MEGARFRADCVIKSNSVSLGPQSAVTRVARAGRKKLLRTAGVGEGEEIARANRPEIYSISSIRLARNRIGTEE